MADADDAPNEAEPDDVRTKPSSRREWWKQRIRRVAPLLQGTNDEVVNFVRERIGEPARSESSSIEYYLTHTREFVFYMHDGHARFALIMAALDSDTMTVSLEEVLTMGAGPDATVDNSRNFAKEILMMAKIEGIPVIADTEEDEPLLVDLIDELLKTGFQSEMDGKVVTLWMPEKHHPLLQPNMKLPLTRHWLPAEFELVRRRLADEMERYRASSAAAAILDNAIHELEAVLASEHLERELHNCVVKNPILFGSEYRRLISEHRLGGQFKMDFALERYSGIVDLVEIEDSRHDLYNVKGDATSHLVHAEQQVYDWLDWIERFHGYASAYLAGVLRPQGFVVIGRRASLSEQDQRKLRQRNQVHRGVFEVLTWDDLLDRAKSLRDSLQRRGST